MIALWASYAMAVSACLAVGALCLDRAARAARLPARWIWASAIAASVVTPFVVDAFATPASSAIGMAFSNSALPRAFSLDRGFLAAWAVGSFMVASLLVREALALWRDGRGWREGMIDGVPVREASMLGPAVVGIARMRIVVPAWVRTLDERSRGLVLLHELEHARARDPLLIAFGAVALVAMPWNAGLWWAVRRLRLAIEIDCDQRVLRREPDARAYALVLVESSARMSSVPLALPTCLSTPRRSLEPRILAMKANHSARRRIAAGTAALAGAAVAIAFACSTPHPNPVESEMRAASGDSSEGRGATYRRVALRSGRDDTLVGRVVAEIEPLMRDNRRPYVGDTLYAFTRGGETLKVYYRRGPVREGRP
jgi:hypothetical protein